MGRPEIFQCLRPERISQRFNEKRHRAKLWPRYLGDAIKLFKSYHAEYADGGQMRDFIYVKDCVRVIEWMLDHEFASGIFNIGTGVARSWNDLASAMFAASGLDPRIEYIDMPEALRDRICRFSGQFHSLEDGVRDYITRPARTPISETDARTHKLLCLIYVKDCEVIPICHGLSKLSNLLFSCYCICAIMSIKQTGHNLGFGPPIFDRAYFHPIITSHHQR